MKQRLRKFGFFSRENKMLRDNLFATFSHLLLVREKRVLEYCPRCKVKSLQIMAIGSCHNGNCIYKFTVRTVKHWKRFSKVVGKS